MSLVSIWDASPSSGAIWLAGMSVETAEPIASMSVRQPRDERLRIGLLAQRQQDALLPGPAVEVVRAVTRAGIVSASAPSMCWIPLGM